MLEALRSAAGTWVVKLFLGLLVVSFAVWGISGQMAVGVGGNSVVTVGGTKVTAVDYRLAYDRQIAVLSQQFGQRLTREQAASFGLEQQVLGQLISGAVLDEQARKLGLGVSRDKIASLAFEDPAFRGVNGQFDRRRFDAVLQQIGMRAEDYLRNREQVAVRQQIVEAVADGITIPDAFLNAVSLYRGESRTAEYLVLPRSLVEPVEEPSEAVLAKYFEDNKKAYAAPEYRKIAYVKLEPADIADPSSITDEQVAKDYAASKARYSKAETRTIEQIVFSTDEAAKAARQKIDAGATFEDIMKEQGKTPADVLLGTFEKARVADKAIAEAAFNLPPNQVSGVVQGAFGSILLRVTQITPEVVRPLTEVAADIRDQLALAEANRILLDVHDAYEDSRAAGESMAEAAAKQKLKMVTVEAVDRNAQSPDGTVVNTMPQSNQLLAEAFESDVGVENEPIVIGSNGYLFYEVLGITPARDRKLDEVKAKVVSDWKMAKATERLSAKAEEARKEIAAGKPLDEIAAALKLEKQVKRGLKRETDDPDLGQPAVRAMFAVRPDAAGVTPAPADGAQIVFKVTEVSEPVDAGPGSIGAEARVSFASGLSDDLLDQLVARLQGEYEVQVNQAAMTQALSF